MWHNAIATSGLLDAYLGIPCLGEESSNLPNVQGEIGTPKVNSNRLRGVIYIYTLVRHIGRLGGPVDMLTEVLTNHPPPSPYRVNLHIFLITKEEQNIQNINNINRVRSS